MILTSGHAIGFGDFIWSKMYPLCMLILSFAAHSTNTLATT